MSEFRRRMLMQSAKKPQSDDWCEYEYDEYASEGGYKLLLINDGDKVSKIEFEDPIPYTPPMELFKDKYYIQEKVKYKCIRNSEIPLNHNLSELIGTYVEIV